MAQGSAKSGPLGTKDDPVRNKPAEENRIEGLLTDILEELVRIREQLERMD